MWCWSLLLGCKWSALRCRAARRWADCRRQRTRRAYGRCNSFNLDVGFIIFIYRFTALDLQAWQVFTVVPRLP